MSEPHTLVTIDTYSALREMAVKFTQPAGLNFVVIVGQPGTGKSHTFRAAAGEDQFYHEGPLAGPKFYMTLYERRDQAIVLDDVDQLFANDDNVTLMKLLCQTDARKRLSWRKHNYRMEQGNVPDQFDTTSRVCVLANDLGRVGKNLAAVLDRALIFEFRPVPAEIHREVGTWFADRQIHDYIGRYLGLCQAHSMRTYVKASELRRLEMDWEGWLWGQWTKSAKLALAARVAADPALTTAGARVKRFQELGGGTRDTYFRWQRVVREMQTDGGTLAGNIAGEELSVAADQTTALHATEGVR